MQHCETIHSFLRFLHLFSGLQEEFDPADVGGGCVKPLDNDGTCYRTFLFGFLVGGLGYDT